MFQRRKGNFSTEINAAMKNKRNIADAAITISAVKGFNYKVKINGNKEANGKC